MLVECLLTSWLNLNPLFTYCCNSRVRVAIAYLLFMPKQVVKLVVGAVINYYFIVVPRYAKTLEGKVSHGLFILYIFLYIFSDDFTHIFTLFSAHRLKCVTQVLRHKYS